MATIADLNCVITFWKNDSKVYMIEANLYINVQRILSNWFNNSQSAYTKAVIKWGDKTITVDSTQEFPSFDGYPS